MNTISVKVISKRDDWNWKDIEWFIDDIRLSMHLADKKTMQLPEIVEPFDDLCPAWTKDLDYAGDVKFVRHLINQDNAIVPIYMCPDDLDFSCIVIVIDVIKTTDFVYWKRAGYERIQDYDFQEERRSGILYTDSYTDEDWEKYGDNIALAECDSEEWHQWITDNWEEELYRRRMNYTYRKYQQDGNILWFSELNFQFERHEYDEMVKTYLEKEELLLNI